MPPAAGPAPGRPGGFPQHPHSGMAPPAHPNAPGRGMPQQGGFPSQANPATTGNAPRPHHPGSTHPNQGVPPHGGFAPQRPGYPPNGPGMPQQPGPGRTPNGFGAPQHHDPNRTGPQPASTTPTGGDAPRPDQNQPRNPAEPGPAPGLPPVALTRNDPSTFGVPKLFMRDVDGWMKDENVLYRGDTRPPEEIKADGGFRPLKPDSPDLKQHVHGDTNAFVSTSTEQKVGVERAGTGEGKLYVINAPGGIHTDPTMKAAGETQEYSESEVLFPGGIDWRYVAGWHTVRHEPGTGLVPGPFEPNPDYIGNKQPDGPPPATTTATDDRPGSTATSSETARPADGPPASGPAASQTDQRPGHPGQQPSPQGSASQNWPAQPDPAGSNREPGNRQPSPSPQQAGQNPARDLPNAGRQHAGGVTPTNQNPAASGLPAPNQQAGGGQYAGTNPNAGPNAGQRPSPGQHPTASPNPGANPTHQPGPGHPATNPNPGLDAGQQRAPGQHAAANPNPGFNPTQPGGSGHPANPNPGPNAAQHPAPGRHPAANPNPGYNPNHQPGPGHAAPNPGFNPTQQGSSGHPTNPGQHPATNHTPGFSPTQQAGPPRFNQQSNFPPQPGPPPGYNQPPGGNQHPGGAPSQSRPPAHSGPPYANPNQSPPYGQAPPTRPGADTPARPDSTPSDDGYSFGPRGFDPMDSQPAPHAPTPPVDTPARTPEPRVETPKPAESKPERQPRPLRLKDLDDERLAAAVDGRAHATKAGMSIFDPGERNESYTANQVKPISGQFVVDLHGGENHTKAGRSNLSADDLAAVLMANPDWDRKTPITLLGCGTGKLPDGFAAQLAAKTGVKVTAPNTDAWVDYDGNVFASESRGRYDRDGSKPGWPPNGEWRSFDPDGTQQVHESPYPPGHTPTWGDDTPDNAPKDASRRGDDEHHDRDDADGPRAPGDHTPDYSPSDSDTDRPDSDSGPTPADEHEVDDRPSTGPDSLPDDLRQIYDNSISTPAGRAFYDANDARMQRAANAIMPDPDRYTVDVHANAHTAAVDGRPVSARELADLIRADPNYDGKPIRLIACETGRDPNGFAAELARELGVDVVAPDKKASNSADGRPMASDTLVGADGKRYKVMPPNGQWHTFHPDGSRSEATSSDGYLPSNTEPDSTAPDRTDQESRDGPLADDDRTAHDWVLSDGTEYTTSLADDQLDTSQSFQDNLRKHLDQSGTGLTEAEFSALRQKDVADYDDADVAAIKAIRETMTVVNGDIAQRVLTGETAASYLANDKPLVIGGNTLFDRAKAGGFTARYCDVAHLGTPADAIEGMRLDYDDPRYEGRNGRRPYLKTDDTVITLRFTVQDSDLTHTPYGGNSDEDKLKMGGDTFGNDPFTGNGFTKSVDHAVPEFILDLADFADDPAEIWALNTAGEQELLAAWNRTTQLWTTTPSGDAWLTGHKAATDARMGRLP